MNPQLNQFAQQYIAACQSLTPQPSNDDIIGAVQANVGTPPTGEPTPTLTVSNGPDSEGLVQYAEVVARGGKYAHAWFLSNINTMWRQDGGLECLTTQRQKDMTESNVGCNPRGVLEPVGPFSGYGHGTSVSSFVHNLTFGPRYPGDTTGGFIWAASPPDWTGAGGDRIPLGLRVEVVEGDPRTPVQVAAAYLRDHLDLSAFTVPGL